MSIKLSSKTRSIVHNHPYVPREKLPGEVEAPKSDIFSRPVYRIGDGDIGVYVPRPGSLRAFALPSRGQA